jgi:hypothetical protein
MKCPKCGNENLDSAKTCINCGTSFEESPKEEGVKLEAMPTSNAQPTLQAVPTKPSTATAPVADMFKFLGNAFIKPVASLKDCKFTDFKNVGILACIVILIGTLVASLVTAISIGFDMIEFGDFVKMFFTDLLLVAGFIFGVSGIYYLVAMVCKKQADFVKLLTVSTVASMPIVLGANILAPAFAQMNLYVGLFLGFALIGYGFVILYEGFNQSLKIEEDSKFKINAIAMTIIFAVGALVFYHFVFQTMLGLDILGELKDLF